jgi:hypothetical protein
MIAGSESQNSTIYRKNYSGAMIHGTVDHYCFSSLSSFVDVIVCNNEVMSSK